MKMRIVYIFAVTMSMFMVNSATAQYNFSNVKSPNSIDVSGYAEIEVEPNLIYLGITIDENETKGKVSVEEMEINMAKALKKAGVDVEKQLTVKDMSSDFKELFLRKDEARTSKGYSLVLYSAAELTGVIVALEKISISNINIERTTRSDLEELRNGLRVKSIKNAKEKATLLVEALGKKLKDVIFISDTDNRYYNVRSVHLDFSEFSGFVASDGTAPKLEFKKMKITYNIGATFTFSN